MIIISLISITIHGNAIGVLPRVTILDKFYEPDLQCVICEDWFHGRHLGRAEDDCDKDEANPNRLVDPNFRYVTNKILYWSL